MIELSKELRNQLYEAGYTARIVEKKRATAVDKEFMNILATIKPTATKVFIEMCNEWYEGFDHSTNQILANIFPDDEYFLAKVVADKKNREARLMRAGE